MKKGVSLFAGFLLFFGLFGFKTEAAGFGDVSAHGFQEEIMYLVEEGIISGYPDGTFRPDRTVTRGEAAIMIGRAFDLDGTQRNTKFKDVSAASKASGYIDAAVKKGIISGYPDNTFRPNATISRGDMSIILSKAFDLHITSIFDFYDVGRNMAAYEHVGKLSVYSISLGYSDGSYRPELKTTRAQFSAFLARALEPKFKQKATIKESYALNKTKQYTYDLSESGEVIYTFKDVGVQFGQNVGFAWEVKSVDTEEKYYMVQEEAHNGLVSYYPMSEIELQLLYTLKLNNSWVSSNTGKRKITALNEKVDTKYGTFDHAVEVTENTGFKSYYVKNIGHVKSIDQNGKTVSELISIK